MTDLFWGCRDIGNKIESIVKPKGYSIVRQYTGHGIDQRVSPYPQHISRVLRISYRYRDGIVPLQPQHCALWRVQDAREDGGRALFHDWCVDLGFSVACGRKLIEVLRDNLQSP